ncbi:MAG: ATP-dependent metallopeptidase FtsH/Yme1/Tma family protein [Planctomycetia bacterium]|nr:ATP-dependent metallopeptidase FtsH/Yme1/Tma family protein [Planctomycetia bacterium]
MDKPPAGPNAQLPKASLRPRLNSSGLWLLLAFALVAAFWYFNSETPPRDVISYSFFREQLDADNIKSVEINDSQVLGKFRVPPTVATTKPAAAKGSQQVVETTLKPDFSVVLTPMVGEDLDQEMRNKKVDVTAVRATDSAGLLLIAYMVGTVLVFGFVYVMFRRARDQFMGGGILGGFSKSPAKRYETTNKPVTFADVAGLEGVKHDLEEVVEFLKNPEKFQRLGGRVPKGILLMGPPGTGKTLLARAVAGEAGVPFFSISGSEFIQMFVGVGASRVRDMFKTAKEASPSILFIDEIDAVGRVRGAGLGGGHDEREQTLNQILSEMDGFSQNESVIVLAATNRPDVLDPALLRPGRFDRHITVDRPNHKGRLAIFKVHSRDVPLADDVDLDRLASGTVGLTGADIRNLVNEAALWATRNGKDKVDMDDFEHARDRVLMGPKREEVLSGKEKRMTAFHESGHALLAWIVPGADRVHKVTIIPRGRSLGVTQLLPEEDRLNIGESELHGRLCFMLGGRAAEKLVFDEYSAGAENDLMQGTRLARRMVTAWGMSERLGPVAYRTSEEHPFLGKEIYEQREFSEHSAQLIDEEVARILHDAADRATRLLEEHRSQLETLANALEEHEVLDEAEIEQLLGPSINKRVAESNGQAVDVAPGPRGDDIKPAEKAEA